MCTARNSSKMAGSGHAARSETGQEELNKFTETRVVVVGIRKLLLLQQLLLIVMMMMMMMTTMTTTMMRDRDRESNRYRDRQTNIEGEIDREIGV